jgi:hypothetical protein
VVSWVVSLLISCRIRRIDDLVGDLLAAVGRQAVHENGVLLGQRHEPAVDLEGGENAGPFFLFGFLSHGGPDVRVDGVGAAHRLLGLIREREVETGLGAVLAGEADHLGIRPVAGRRSHGHLHPAPGRGQEQTVADVVPVADVGQLESGQGPPVLLQGEDVGHRLARVGKIRQGVDNGDPRAPGEVDGDLVAVGPDHDPVHPALEVLADVEGALAASHLDVRGREIDGFAAQLEHAHLEGHARPQGGLLEDHR